MELARRILHVLADGERHAFDTIATRIGAGSDAVTDELTALHDGGCPVRLDDAGHATWTEPVALLDAARVASLLAGDGVTAGETRAVTLVDSTNAALMRAPLESLALPAVLMAEGQSGGRGRSGRPWRSPFGVNVYLSVAFEWTRPLPALTGLSVALGIALAERLRALGVDGVTVKWPNDVLAGGAKLAGILVETGAAGAGRCRVVAGIGVNVNASTIDGVDQAWTSVARCTGRTADRDAVAAGVARAAIEAYTQFAGGGMAPFLPRWAPLDAFAARVVRTVGDGPQVSGTNAGIDAIGRLLIETADGTVAVDAGEVSLRPMSGDI